jgi:hypothetical protein
MRLIGFFLFSALFCISAAPELSYAQGTAPEMFGVGEVVVEYAQFADPSASDTCSLSREQIASVLSEAFVGTKVPAVAASEAKPQILGIARIQFVPMISSHVDENLGCISWISVSAESRINAVIPPVSPPRSVTAVYWRQNAKVSSGQSIHAKKVAEILKKIVDQFAQQYKLDQPGAVIK